MSEARRKRLLAFSDSLLDWMESERLRGNGRGRVTDTLWDHLEWVGRSVGYEPDPPTTYRECQDWLFRLQARRLLLAQTQAGQRRTRKEIRLGAWKRLGLPAPVDGPDWWDLAEAMLERLEARWDYAATWARRDPCRRRVAAMLAAWEDYFTARARLEDLGVHARRAA